MRLSLLTASLLLALGPLAAQSAGPSPQGPDWQFILQWDNDLLSGSDEGYTNGTRLAMARELPSDSRQHDILQTALRRLTGADRDAPIDAWRFPREGASRFHYGVGLTQLMFTPEDPDRPRPAPGERPYAGWLGVEFSLQASGPAHSSTATLSIGTTGDLSYAQDIQTWIHENVSDSPVFQGWDSQAPGEVTLNLHFDHRRRLSFLEPIREGAFSIDALYGWGLALGNFRTDAYLGALFRAGFHLPARQTTPRLQLGSFTEALFDAPDGPPEQVFSLYGFVGLRGYAVAHDISLDGPVFTDWDEAVDSEPWVGELNAGLASEWRWWQISLSHTLRTDEFERQRNRSRYGSLVLRIGANF